MTGPRKQTPATALARLTKPAKLSETAVGLAVASWVAMMGGRIYNAETGFLGHYDGEGVRHARKGGTRSTPGTPDMPVVLMAKPWHYTLTVELKGTDTAIKPKDWVYALDAATYGQPHLIVRSGEEFLTGLRYLGLLPRELEQVQPRDWDAWPQNINFLNLTLDNADLWRDRAMERKHADRLPGGQSWWNEERRFQLAAKRIKPLEAALLRR